MGSYIPTQSPSLIVYTVVWCMCVKHNMVSWFFPCSSHAKPLVHFVALHARLKAVSALVWRARTWVVYQIIGKMQLVSEFFMKRIVSVVKAHFFSVTWLERHVNNASAHLDSSLSASPALKFGGPTTRGIENWARMPHLSIAGTSALSLDKIFLFAHDTMNFDVPLPNYGGFMSSVYMVCEFWVAKACLDS
jgi:hypothetical protein